MKDVVVIAGSKSDLELARKCVEVLEKFEIQYELHVASAHREPEKVKEIVNKGAKVFIAIAGLSAALPGFIASLTTSPVIGVPVNVKLGGLDSLLSIVQMPKGVPVGCVGIDNTVNAALLAVRILAVDNPKLKEKLKSFSL